MNEERMLKWFEFSHLPDGLKETSARFYDIAYEIIPFKGGA